MSQILGQHLSQQLKLTPQLRQSLEVLQLSSQALEQKVMEELTQNPLLEIEEVSAPEAAQPETGTDPTSDQDWQYRLDVRKTSSGDATSQNPIDRTAAYHETLREHLLREVGLTNLSQRDQMIATLVIDSLDNDGYFRSTCEEIQTICPAELQVETAEVHAVLSMIKSLEPAGVGAADLAERLSLLLLRQPEETPFLPLAKQMVDNHLQLLAERKFDQLLRKLNTNREQLSQAIELITSLNPRIESLFSEDNWDQITPDILVIAVNQGYEARLNPQLQTRLKINESYRQMAKTVADTESSRYIKGRLTDAKAFINSVNSRFDTLLRVAQALVAEQQGFFASGVEHLTPLSRRQIAEQLELHDSTISRAVTGKYLQCKYGVFELSYFFSSSIGNEDGSAASSKTICNLIAQIIDAESKQKPISDSKIAEQLSTKGYSIARRTVAKYRESMHIPPSSRRKVI